MPEILVSPAPVEPVSDVAELRTQEPTHDSADITGRTDPTDLTDPTDADAFRSLYERSGLCMALFDTDLRLREANEQFHRDFGGRANVARDRDLFEFIKAEPRSGLRGQLLKQTADWCGRVSARVHATLADGRVCPARLTALGVRRGGEHALLLVVQWPERAAQPPSGRGGQQPVLTELDARILIGIAMGMSTVNLAAKLYLSRQGIEYHVSTMLKKLKACNRAELVSRAYATGVITPHVWPPRIPSEFIK